MQSNKKIIYSLVLMSMLFLSLLGYLTYFELFEKEKIINSSYNLRQWEREDDTHRGNIYDRTGMTLAESKFVGEKQERYYPYGNLYCHVIGYNSRTYGKSLLEAQLNKQLLNINEFNPVFDFKNKLTGAQKTGNNVSLTLDHKLQEKADKLLKDRNGAIVAMNPRTGEILCMVSKPDFNPNEDQLKENWKKMIDDETSPFLPRATQGLYVPGSTFKIVISTAAVDNYLDKQIFDDQGTVTIDGKEFKNTNKTANGKIDLKTALSKSSNVVFSQVGVQLGADILRNTAQNFGLGKDIPFDLPVSKSQFPYKSMRETDMAAASIGQGKILVTPLHMAMITSCIANDGIMMKPLLVREVTTPDGTVLEHPKPTPLNQVVSTPTANKVRDMMIDVVEKGTGRRADIQGIQVAGKTGTAENELTFLQKNKEHAWFVGFAPAEDPRIAIAVILEYSGSTGGEEAAPIVRELIKTWISTK